MLCLHKVTETNKVHSIGQDGCWQQFGTTHVIVNATHWLNRPCSAPSWFDRVQEKPAVKADVAIYTYMLGVSGQYKSVDLVLSYKLDFNSCVN